jgi:hypothetical protein
MERTNFLNILFWTSGFVKVSFCGGSSSTLKEHSIAGSLLAVIHCSCVGAPLNNRRTKSTFWVQVCWRYQQNTTSFVTV